MVTKEQVYGALENCFDPEIQMVNLVELGLIYDVDIDGGNIKIQMTLTTPGCGMVQMIAADVKTKVEAVEGVSEVAIEIVWDPPWTPDRIADSAKKKLGYA